MQMGPVILVAATMGLVMLIAPHLDADGGAQIKAPPPRQVESSDKAAWLAGETVLTRASDGHFYADADVQQHSTHFLIDTGATIVVLTGADARAIGLDWSDNQLMPIGRGASGTVYGVPVRLSQVELGGMEVRDVPAAIVPEGLDVSLLGQSFLTHIGNVRIEREHMTLGAGTN